VSDFTNTTVPFYLRGVAGQVLIEYGRNDDPVRWGYDVLGPRFSPPSAQGFPVIQASVDYEREGYAAFMAWVQVVRVAVLDTGERETMFDVNPQMETMEMPFLALGVRPTLFDAPSTNAGDVTWDADTFLVHTPDVLSRAIHPNCGFRWGYRVTSGEVSLLPVTIGDEADWDRNLPDLRDRYPTWTFGTTWPSATNQ
jgi:hypothetical protein